MYLQKLTGGLMVKTVCFYCRGHGFDPWGTKKLRSCMLHGVAKKNKSMKLHKQETDEKTDAQKAPEICNLTVMQGVLNWGSVHPCLFYKY